MKLKNLLLLLAALSILAIIIGYDAIRVIYGTNKRDVKAVMVEGYRHEKICAEGHVYHVFRDYSMMGIAPKFDESGKPAECESKEERTK